MSKALEKTGGAEVKGTAKFVEMLDKYFDCLNVSNFTNGTVKRKPFQHPYRYVDDHRLKVYILVAKLRTGVNVPI